MNLPFTSRGENPSSALRPEAFHFRPGAPRFGDAPQYAVFTKLLYNYSVYVVLYIGILWRDWFAEFQTQRLSLQYAVRGRALGKLKFPSL